MTGSHKIEADVEIENIQYKVKNRNFDHPFMPLEFYYNNGHQVCDLKENPSRLLEGYEDGTWECPNEAEDDEKCPYHSEDFRLPRV